MISDKAWEWTVLCVIRRLAMPQQWIDRTTFHVYFFIHYYSSRIMKKLLTLAVAAVIGFAANAQTALIATLSHDGEITVFNGSGALIDAHKAAVDGDVITLSSGSFSAPTITKAITVRGAGMFAEENGTIVVGRLYVKLASNNSGLQTMIEGLHFSERPEITDARLTTFSKCSFENGIVLTLNDVDGRTNTVCFINSFIKETTYMSSVKGSNNSVVFQNSVVYNPQSTSSSTFTYDNCVIYDKQISLSGSSVRNSFIYTKNANPLSGGFSSSATIANSYIRRNDTSSKYIGQCVSINNTLIPSTVTDVWENADRYILKEEYANAWLGNDGTQVGIYGGLVPFDPTPAGPQITKFNVGAKTSADGKLTVDIEVKTAD